MELRAVIAAAVALAPAFPTPWATNVTFQYRIAKVITPEVEVNWTQWLDGTQRGGKKGVPDRRRRAREHFT
jgi:hypothetical protein